MYMHVHKCIQYKAKNGKHSDQHNNSVCSAFQYATKITFISGHMHSDWYMCMCVLCVITIFFPDFQSTGSDYEIGGSSSAVPASDSVSALIYKVMNHTPNNINTLSNDIQRSVLDRYNIPEEVRLDITCACYIKCSTVIQALPHLVSTMYNLRQKIWP